MHYVEKNNLFLAQLPGISANSNENYTPYNFQAFYLANISRKFPEMLNFRKIYNHVLEYKTHR